MTALDWTIAGIVTLLFMGVIVARGNSHYEKQSAINQVIPAKVIDLRAVMAKPVDVEVLRGQIVNVRWAINQ